MKKSSLGKRPPRCVGKTPQKTSASDRPDSATQGRRTLPSASDPAANAAADAATRVPRGRVEHAEGGAGRRTPRRPRRAAPG